MKTIIMIVFWTAFGSIAYSQTFKSHNSNFLPKTMIDSGFQHSSRILTQTSGKNSSNVQIKSTANPGSLANFPKMKLAPAAAPDGTKQIKEDRPKPPEPATFAPSKPPAHKIIK